MALFSERERERLVAEREAAGESLWRKDFPPEVRVRLARLLRLAHVQLRDVTGSYLGSEVSERIEFRIGITVRTDIDALRDDNNVVVWLNWLGAAHEVLEANLGPEYGAGFSDEVNTILRQHRLMYKFVEDELISFESDELLQGVVEPALRLLVGQRFKAAHDAYLEALEEISNDAADDAIKDAGRALQELLDALGCEGNVLSTLIKDGREKGLFRSHDQQLEEALVLITKWAASDRNKLGGTHKQSDAAIADAWLMVHVVGALIVRLADPNPRGSLAES